MPIYEFKCRHCGHRFEELCRMGEDGLELRCPACGRRELQRCQSTFAARSTGDGGVAHSVGGKSCAPT